jgi:hypothetical protein
MGTPILTVACTFGRSSPHMKAYGVQGMDPLFKYVLDPVYRPYGTYPIRGKESGMSTAGPGGFDTLLLRCEELGI